MCRTRQSCMLPGKHSFHALDHSFANMAQRNYAMPYHGLVAVLMQKINAVGSVAAATLQLLMMLPSIKTTSALYLHISVEFYSTRHAWYCMP